MTQEQKETKEFIVYTIGLVRNTFLIVLITYFAWFLVYQQQGISSDISNWGAFGDYFGGIMNPMVACAALLLLAKSLKIQHQELSATRKALSEASTAQTEQAKVAINQSKVDTYKASLEVLSIELQAALNYQVVLSQLANERIAGTKGKVVNLNAEKVELVEEVQRVSDQINDLRNRHLSIIKMAENLNEWPK